MNEAPSALAKMLNKHVASRGGPTLQNGAWDMMLAAADLIMFQEKQISDAYSRLMILGMSSCGR